MSITNDWTTTKSLQEWWATPSQSSIKRPYTAETVLKLRDIFPENTISNFLSLKLRETFERQAKAGTSCFTYGVPDGVGLQKMAEAGFECAYVSGSYVAKSATLDPGTDLADYTYDSVPKRVELLNRAQLLQARIAQFHSAGSGADTLLPLLADGDSGHGQSSGIMKLIKLFVQSGVAGIHIDDLLAGTKRFDRKDGEGWICVPTCEAIRRLTATRLQLDVMGSEIVLVYRTDGGTADRITNTIDHRDRPFILGASAEQPIDYAALIDSPSRASWKAAAGLMTLDEAFESAHPKLFSEFTRSSEGMNVSSAMRVATKLAPDFYWSCDAARNPAGYYLFRGGAEAAAARAIAGAHLADMVWMNSASHDAKRAEVFSKRVQGACPGKWMGFNVTGAFPTDGSRDAEIEAIPSFLASLKYTWVFMPNVGIASTGIAGDIVSKVLKERRVLGFVQEVSRPADLQPQGSVEWWNKKMGQLTDAASEAIGDGL